MFDVLDNILETWQCRPRRRVQRSLIAASLGDTRRGHSHRLQNTCAPFPSSGWRSWRVGWMDGLMSQRVGKCGVLEEVHAVVTVLDASRGTIQPSQCCQLVHVPRDGKPSKMVPSSRQVVEKKQVVSSAAVHVCRRVRRPGPVRRPKEMADGGRAYLIGRHLPHTHCPTASLDDVSPGARRVTAQLPSAGGDMSSVHRVVRTMLCHVSIGWHQINQDGFGSASFPRIPHCNLRASQ